MIIYLCIKFQSNTPILSKDIARKPFFKVENFSKLKRALTPKIIGGFYLKSSLTYTNPLKRYRTETICVTGGTDGWDGRTYGQRWYCMPHPIENGGGIKKKKKKKPRNLLTAAGTSEQSDKGFVNRFRRIKCFSVHTGSDWVDVPADPILVCSQWNPFIVVVYRRKLTVYNPFKNM